MGDYEEMMTSWCLRKELIENSPSRHDGISAALEAQTRSQYCQFIRLMCSQFKLDTIPTATAMMFCHRFYALQSLAKNDWKTIATACVFLSAKSEDSFRSLDDIVKIAFASDVQKLPTDSQRKDFLHMKRELIEMAEKVVLINLRFDTNVKHPYRPLHNAMKLLGINSKEIRREVWKLVGCWLESTLCLQYRPEWIAAASLHILGKLHGMKLPDVRGLPLWSEKFSPRKWDDCTSQMAQILCMQNWPQCTRLMEAPARPQLKPVSKPEPKPKHVSIQKLPEAALEPKENKPKVVTPDSVLVMAENAGKMPDIVPKRETIVLDSSGFSEDAPVLEQKTAETKQESCIGLNMAYVARIREVVRKRKRTAESCPVVGKARLDTSGEISDDWIERELESGIIVGSKPGFSKENAEPKTEVVSVDTSRRVNDSWIEKELEEGIIIDSRPASHKKAKGTGESRASFKVERCGGLKAWRERQRGREAETNHSSKRQRR